MKKTSLLLILLLASCGHQATADDASPAPASLLSNGSFEEGDNGWTVFIPPDAKDANCRFTISQDSPHSGASCGLLQADNFARFGLIARDVPVQPGERYRVGAWVRGGPDLQFQPRTPGVLIRLSLTQNKQNSPSGPFYLTLGGGETRTYAPADPAPVPTQWTHMEAVVEIPPDADELGLYFFSWAAKGSLYVDDITLEKVDSSVSLTQSTEPPQPAPAAQSQSGESRETPVLPYALIPEQPAWAQNHPRVIFDTAGLARVKQRIHDYPEIADLWNKVKEKCDGFVDPQSPTFVDASKALDDYVASASPTLSSSLQGRNRKVSANLEAEMAKWLLPLNMLDFAYAVSGDERYGKKAVELAVAVAQKLTPEEMKGGFYYSHSLPTRSLALAFDWCYPLFTSDQRQIVRQSLVDQANDLYYQNLNNTWGQSSLGRIWNWNPGLASACGLAALVLNGETHAPTRMWLFQSICNVEDYLRFALDAQGGALEGPSYFEYGSGFTPFLVEAMRARAGVDLYATTNYKHFLSWLPMEMLPGGNRVNNIVESDYGMYVLDPALYAMDREPDRALARYLWEQLVRPKISAPYLAGAILWAPEDASPADVAACAAKLPDWGWAGGRGLVVSRSGWGPDDAYMSLDAQHYTHFRHDRAGKGEFTFYAYGDDLAISSGYGSLTGDAQNQVLVDGHPEILGGQVAQTDGWIVNSLHEPLVDLTCADVADAYRFFYKIIWVSYQEVYQQDFQRADRHALFIRAPFPYAVVFDDVKKDDSPHDYTWLLHARDGKAFERAGNTIQVVPGPATPQPGDASQTANKIKMPAHSAWLQVAFLTPDQWEEKTDVFQTFREGAHPRLSVTMHGTDGQFLTLLLPHRLKDGKPDGALDVQSLPAQKGHAGLVPITADTSDLVACWDGSTGITVQDIDTDAELLWLRRDASGKIVGAAASNVSHLTLGGRQIFTSNGGKTCFVLDGDQARVPEDADVKFDLPAGEIKVEKVNRPTDWFSSPPANE